MKTEVDLINPDLMYEVHSRELTQTEALKQIADRRRASWKEQHVA